jgi:hypothetical protein
MRAKAIQGLIIEKSSCINRTTVKRSLAKLKLDNCLFIEVLQKWAMLGFDECILNRYNEC